MKIHRIKDILSKMYNRKFREGFTKYLASLDYNEFDFMYNYYTSILIKVINRYTKNKPKFLSKRWFNYNVLYMKYSYLFHIFMKANSEFVVLSNKLLKENNAKVSKLIEDINEKQRILKHIASTPLTFSEYSTIEDRIKFYLAVVDNIYSTEILEKSIEELKTLKK